MGAGSSKPEGSAGSKHVFTRPVAERTSPQQQGKKKQQKAREPSGRSIHPNIRTNSLISQSNSNVPVQFSSNLVEALQTNTEVRLRAQETSPTRFSTQPPIPYPNHNSNKLTKKQTDSSRAKSLELQIQARVAQELERLREREQQTLAEIEKRLAEVKDSAPASSSSSTPNISYPAGSLNLDAPRIPFAGREYESTPAPAAVTDQPVNRDLSRESVNAEIEQLRAKLEGRRKLVEVDEGVERARNEVVTCLRLNDRRPLDCWKEVEGFKREVARLEEAFVDRVVG
ncbi:Mic19 family protein [Aspergillus thermomutatus]|uniref:MICOS complex subunit mic19 n=1 Tax=Aspergillus thermomutatus TaxID=41047 RepID=A0A397GY48_ASPTH|nr:uncharacterized protein CDV56_102606 [Aspergillus thermomutatus]RHZ55922.1 hypothetical protein CDV56_102606 [Aspergillus thermomutatus]